jgi:glycosyltransferase involved in cell wall biosynthesis
VVTDIGAMQDYLTEDCGVFTTPGSVKDLVEAVTRLFGDETRRASMSAAARARSLEFSWPRIARQVNDLYRSLQA